MIRRIAISVAALFAGLFTLSGIATADKPSSMEESVMKLAVQEANNALGGVTPFKRPLRSCKQTTGAADPGQRGHGPPGAAAPKNDCERWPTHTGPWVDPSKVVIKDKKGGEGNFKYASWKGTTAEGIDYEVTMLLMPNGTQPWKRRVVYKDEHEGADPTALPGPND